MKKLILMFSVFFTLLSLAFQIDKTFPVSENDFDDSVLTNQIFEFKGFITTKDRSFFILTCNNNFFK